MSSGMGVFFGAFAGVSHLVLFDGRNQARNTLDCKHNWMV